MIFESSPCAREASAILHKIAARPAKHAARMIDKPVALYGAGNLGRMALEFLERIGQPPDLIVDANAAAFAHDAFWQGKPISAPGEVASDVRESFLLVVSIATLPYETLAAALAADGWRDIVPFYDVAEAYRDIHPLGNGWVLDRLDDDDVEATCRVLGSWEDDVSRAHHLQFLAWHRLREDWTFKDAPVHADNRYFIPEVVAALGTAEAFLDVGAHHGEVSQRLCAILGNSIKALWMIEPDPFNAATASEAIAKMLLPDKLGARLFKVAVASEGGTERFYSGLGYASQLSSLGHDLIPVATIDALKLAPTFIKMHLEGHELAALMGAQMTLRNCRPILAITTYHSDLGVWRLPLWLMNKLPDYKHYFRMHSWAGTGTVAYCIPAEWSRNAADHDNIFRT